MTNEQKNTITLDPATSIVSFVQEHPSQIDKKQGVVWYISTQGCVKYNTKAMSQEEAEIAVEKIALALEEEYRLHKAVSSFD